MWKIVKIESFLSCFWRNVFVLNINNIMFRVTAAFFCITFSLFQNLFRFNQWDIIGHRTLCVLHHQLVNMLLSIYWKQLLHVYIRNTICAVHYCLQAYLWEDLEQNCSFFLLHKCCTYMYVNSQKPFNHHTVSVLSWRPVH